MAQHSRVEIPIGRYTRADFTALRAHLNRIPVERITDLYYHEDDREQLGIHSSTDLRRRLDALRDELVQRAVDVNPLLATALHEARRSARWSKTAIDYLVQAADKQNTAPRPTDPVSMWLRPRIAKLFKAEGARSLAELIELINIRGTGWWRPIPRIGKGKADAITAWLARNSRTLGEIVPENQYPTIPDDKAVLLSPDYPVLIPFDRIALPEALSGKHGVNRNALFCLIYAHNDLEAIKAYLYKFRAQEKTRRAYQKELERFLLWCILERRRPLSSVLLEDCEAYKDFIANPPVHWIGPKASRLGTKWKPFAGQLSPKSQRYAVQAIRTFFSWLVDVRYLSGNPWKAISDPLVTREITSLKIEKALPKPLWDRLIEILNYLAAESDEALRFRHRLRGSAAKISLPAQYRLARAAILLMGDGGLRREEAANAQRRTLRPLYDVPDLWELDVLGKRNKWRTTFLPKRAIEALQAHWADRGLDFGSGGENIPLLAPLVLPHTKTAQDRHTANSAQGLTPDGLYKVICTTLKRLCTDPTVELNQFERNLLLNSGPHAFRHTFGTTASAAGVPVDVLQKAFGHASLQTTTIYIQAEKKRSMEELGKFFRRDGAANHETHG